jgi:DNA polymerase-3 subunit beta
MRLLIQNTELIRAIATGARIAEKPNNHILIQALVGGIRITACDKAMTYVGMFAANVETPGEVAVDATNALQVAKVLPAGTVSLNLGENFKIDVMAGKSNYKLSGEEASKVQPLPSFDTNGVLSIAAPDLRRIIDQTWFSIAPDDNRYGLNGAHLDSVGTPDAPILRMVGTDGNRLSWAQAPFTGKLTIGRRMLLPRGPLAEVRKMIDGYAGLVEIGFGERAAVVRFEGTTVHMRLLEAEFPNYREVLPTTFKRRVVVDRDVITDALRRVSVFAVDMSHSVRFAFTSDGLVMTSRKLDAGDAREELPIDMSGEAITMGFNAAFLQSAIGATVAARVTLNLGDALMPCIIQGFEDENALFVVMPVRLD